MKKLFVFILVSLLAVELFAAESYKVGMTVYVSVKKAKIDKTEVEYGDALIIDDVSEKKVLAHLVEDETITGWISVGSITKKKIVKSENGAARASTTEISLAGKGFSETAENVFKSENPEIDFGVVDKMEAIEVSDEAIAKFIEEGYLCAE